MKNTLEYSQAPDFQAIDAAGKTISLADYRRQKNVFLVFNRGFA